ncbi:MAG: aspartate carbamoyltransferase catalytic subunit [Chloroflexi bacterium]|nr:aspartate carbamoyltransferase catalytic subunit [Chloroflexota bacterium]
MDERNRAGSVTPQTVERPGGAAWRHHHVLDLDDLSRGEIETVFQTADAMMEVLSREVKKVPTLRGKTVVTLFYEPSTRTRASFELAAKNLSADVVSFAASGSSVEKGESFIDTLRTLQALGADAIVIRHKEPGAPYVAARNVGASVINAGDGWHAHPSQALLDLYTLRRHFPTLEGLRVVILGDILHSRVARSNIWGLSAMGAQVVLCAPPTLLPADFVRQDGGSIAPGLMPAVSVETNIERALDGADVVMPLRLQVERQEGGLLPSLREYVRLYQLTESRLALAREHAIVLHPGPVNEGVEVAPEVVHGARSVIEEQVSVGVAVRMALLFLVAGGGGT